MDRCIKFQLDKLTQQTELQNALTQYCDLAFNFINLPMLYYTNPYARLILISLFLVAAPILLTLLVYIIKTFLGFSVRQYLRESKSIYQYNFLLLSLGLVILPQMIQYDIFYQISRKSGYYLSSYYTSMLFNFTLVMLLQFSNLESMIQQICNFQREIKYILVSLIIGVIVIWQRDLKILRIGVPIVQMCILGVYFLRTFHLFSTDRHQIIDQEFNDIRVTSLSSIIVNDQLKPSLERITV